MSFRPGYHVPSAKAIVRIEVYGRSPFHLLSLERPNSPGQGRAIGLHGVGRPRLHQLGIPNAAAAVGDASGYGDTNRLHLRFYTRN